MQSFSHKTASGLRIQGINIPGSNVITTMILAGAGSRYETKDVSGISHFLEHMFFKGAEKYKTPKAVSEAVDSFGGEFNAFTGKEYAGYYIKSGKNNIEKSLEVLSDMLLYSTFPAEEIEKERRVILEEMAMYKDAPMYQISWDFERLVFGDQPLGWDQIGSEEVIKRLQQSDFFDYQKKLYTPENIVVTLAGGVNEALLARVAEFFDIPNTKNQIHLIPFDPSIPTKKCQIREKKTEQYHLAFGIRSVAEKDENFPTLTVLSTILGGNMSSRLFQHVREKKGLCYSIRTQVDEYTDTSLLVTRSGVSVDSVSEAVEAVREEYDLIAQKGIDDDELEKAKNYLLGRTDLDTEDSESVAHWYGKELLLYGKIDTHQDWKEKIKSVKKSAVENLAQEIFVPENFRFAGIGPGFSEESAEKILAS